MATSQEKFITIRFKQVRESSTLDELLSAMEFACAEHNAYVKTLTPIFNEGKFSEWELTLQKYPY